MTSPVAAAAASVASRNMIRACAAKSVLMMCDMQPVFAKTIQKMPHVVETANTLLSAGRILNIPGVVTEQYPEKLGHTLPELDLDTSHCRVFSKHSFSMMTDDVVEYLNKECSDRDQYILMGIESHICVTQTTLDILTRHPQSTVFLVTDGISSSRLLDRSTALHRLSAAGAVLTTSESLIFDMMQAKDHPNFKELSAVVRTINTRTPREEQLQGL
ncbi:Isochorismatase domain-containing protein 1 [Perkinsus olseni]|uniref:Isochorismatase domain-containing protein 1 n=2 Tax=Perkinsus olseni TaxID=32597 RepID=A0A7J6T282_PEROL|nr:Isochorismatase domain-containing protein 1 [Perkinsus olseni]